MFLFIVTQIYYFEIPVNPGEYALGSVSEEKERGAYLIYLDISASATVDGDSKIISNFNTTEITDAGKLSYTEIEPTENETPTYFPLFMHMPTDAPKLVHAHKYNYLRDQRIQKEGVLRHE